MARGRHVWQATFIILLLNGLLASARKCEPLPKVRQFEIGNFEAAKWIQSWKPWRSVSVRITEKPALWNVERACEDALWSFFLTRGKTRFYVSYNEETGDVKLSQNVSKRQRSFYALLQPDGRVLLLAANTTNRFLVLNGSLLAMNYTNFPPSNSRWSILESFYQIQPERTPYYVEIQTDLLRRKWISSGEEADPIHVARDSYTQICTTNAQPEQVTFQTLQSSLYASYSDDTTMVDLQTDLLAAGSRQYEMISSKLHGYKLLIRTYLDQNYTTVSTSNLLSLTPYKALATAWLIDVIGFYHSVDIIFPHIDVICGSELQSDDDEEACRRKRRMLRPRYQKPKIRKCLVRTGNETFFCHSIGDAPANPNRQSSFVNVQPLGSVVRERKHPLSKVTHPQRSAPGPRLRRP